MKWEYIGTGLGLLAIGITLMVALPPPWAPKMSTQLVNAGILVGVIFSLVGLAIASIGVWPGLPGNKLGPIFLLSLGTVLFCAGVVWYLTSPDRSLPGFGSFAYIRLYDTPELRRRVIYNFVSSNNGGIKFFLSPSGLFNFTISDVNGEPYSLEIPIGAEGIPIDRFIFLFCEVGFAEDKTIMRVSVDEKEVAYRSLPFRIEVGKMDWKQGAIGGDVNGQNNAPFKISEFGLFKSTLTPDQRSKLIANFRTYLKDIGSPPS